MENNDPTHDQWHQSFENSSMKSPVQMVSEHDAAYQGSSAILQSALQAVQHRIHTLEESFTHQQQQITKLQGVVTEVTNLNEGLFKYVSNLEHRIVSLEQCNTRSKSYVEKQDQGFAVGVGIGSAERSQYQRDPDQTPSASTSSYELLPPFSVGLPTPLTPAPETGSTTGRWNGLEITPGIPPTPTTPGGSRRSQTFLNKRESHNLTNMIPPVGVQIPLVPLTDAELIVFFFNCLQRPIVALRLYARNWGPAEITRVLNEHRDIRPDGYQRNTCSVKCTTAIRRGRERYGSQWESHWRQVFLDADDADATDAIRLKETEIRNDTNNSDFRVLDLLNGLKKLPCDDGKEAGAFTGAIEWCARNDVDINISQIHSVVIALEHGLDPADALESKSSPTEDMLVDVELVESRSSTNPPVGNVATTTVTSTLSESDKQLLDLEDSEEAGMNDPTADKAKRRMIKTEAE